MSKHRVYLVLCVVAGIVAVFATLRALALDFGVWRLLAVLPALAVLVWAIVTARRNWRERGTREGWVPFLEARRGRR
jgi:hypothetical protein